MIPEIGILFLTLSLAGFAYGFFLPLVKIGYLRAQAYAFVLPACMLGAVFILCAAVCLFYSFYQNDFSVLAVFQNSHSKLPLAYKLAAFWGGHEGSLLLWILMLAVWTLWANAFTRQWPLVQRGQLMQVLAGVQIGFLLFILFTSNPFSRLLPFSPNEGQDLNPLLQDPGLVIHPPMLYMGYVGFSVAFAFAILALRQGKLSAPVLQGLRFFALMAWSFLTLGIILGSWWAYYELGWGGWWFWDPVENASLMPWLMGTALIHALILSKRKNIFIPWTLLLAIFTFGLSLLGTFLVRSGVLTSVHAFAHDPQRGVFILLLLGIYIGGALTYYGMQAKLLTRKATLPLLFSRESLLLFNTLLFAVIAFTVILGTLYPILVQMLWGDDISVGPPYFNAVFVPLVTLGAFLMIITPFSRSDTMLLQTRRQQMAFVGVVLLVIALGVLIGQTVKLALFVLGAGLAVGLLFVLVLEALKKPRWSLKWSGYALAHLGLAVTLLGVAGVTHFQTEKLVSLSVGEHFIVKGYDFHFANLKHVTGANFSASVGRFDVTHHNKKITTMFPEKRLYHARGQILSETAISPGFFQDFYLALGTPLDKNETQWSVRIYLKPFVRFIWGGGLLMMLGGFIAALGLVRRAK